MKLLPPCTLSLATALALGSAQAATVLGPDLRGCPPASAEAAPLFHIVPVGAPRIERLGQVRLAGIDVDTATHSTDFFAAVGNAWAALPGALATIPTKTNQSFSTDPTLQGYFNFAACFSQPGATGFHFMPSVEVTSFDGVPDGITGIALAARTYAVFTYVGLPQGLGDFRFSIDEAFFPSSSLRPLDAPDLEVYAPDYDPTSPLAIAEVWVAVVPEPATAALVLLAGVLLGGLRARVQRP